jgi:hypothetical protein
MASLTTHLRRPDDHGRLAFHPDCPVCRDERLAGGAPADTLVGHRTQALLAASVFALSSAPATAAIAAEPDQEREGAIGPDQATAATPAADPESDPGGSSIELPVDPAPPEPQEEPDAADEPALEPEPPPDAAPAEETGTAAPEEPALAPEEPALAPTEPVPAPPAPVTPTPAAPPPEAAATEPAPGRTPERVRKARKRTTVAAPRGTVLLLPAPEPQPVDAGWSPPASTEAARVEPAAGAVRRGGRVHVVRPNESLWSIARGLLGEGASAARIAREVNRLWELNSVRIGTGAPDLLIAGTRLKLR